jgi:hypothetical protein
MAPCHVYCTILSFCRNCCSMVVSLVGEEITSQGGCCKWSCLDYCSGLPGLESFLFSTLADWFWKYFFKSSPAYPCRSWLFLATTERPIYLGIVNNSRIERHDSIYSSHSPNLGLSQNTPGVQVDSGRWSWKTCDVNGPPRTVTVPYLVCPFGDSDRVKLDSKHHVNQRNGHTSNWGYLSPPLDSGRSSNSS